MNRLKKISENIIAVTAAKLSDASKTATNISNVLVNTAAKNRTPANTTVTNATTTTTTATNVTATNATATNATATNVTAAISTHKGKAAAKCCQKVRKPSCEPLTSQLQATDTFDSLVTADDVLGAIFDERIAQALIDIPVEISFPNPPGIYTGKVTSYDKKEDFGNAILHQVTFEDGDQEEFSFTQICDGHQRFLQRHAPEAPNQVIALKPVDFDPALPTPPTLAETAAHPASPFLVPLPLGYANYPLQYPVNGVTV